MFDDVSSDEPLSDEEWRDDYAQHFEQAPILASFENRPILDLGPASASAGLIGLAMMLFVIAAAVPFEFELLEEAGLLNTKARILADVLPVHDSDFSG